MLFEIKWTDLGGKRGDKIVYRKDQQKKSRYLTGTSKKFCRGLKTKKFIAENAIGCRRS